MAVPVLRMTAASGRSLDDPTAEALHDFLANMNLRWPFVIVDRLDREPAGQHYMQVYLNDDLTYQVEYREGGEDQHFQAHIPRQHEIIGCEPVARILQDWAFGPSEWREAVEWTPWSPPAELP
jgi:hypothetical protein